MSTARPGTDRRRARQAAQLVAGMLLVALLVRLPILGQRSLSLDEVLSLRFAALDWRAFVEVMRGGEANMLPYYLLLRGWLHLGGSAFAIRLLSVIPSVATVPLMYALGTRLFGRRVGLVSAALLAVNAFDVRYAQQARSYTLVTFLVTLGTLCFVAAVERRRVGYWVAYVLASVLAVYAQFFAGLVLIAQWIALCAARPRAVPWRALAVSGAVIGVLVLPVGQFIFTRDVGQLEWVPASGILSVRGLLFAFAGGSDGAGWLYLLACLAGLATNRTSSATKGSAASWHFRLTVCWLVVPIVLLLAFSYVKPMFVHRYLMVCLPPYLMLVALGIDAIRSDRLFAAALAVVLLVSGYRVIHYYDKFAAAEDWRGVTEYVLTHAEQRDAVVFYVPGTRYCFEYYRNKLPLAPRPDLAISSTEVSAAAIESLASRFERLWLVVGNAPANSGEQLRRLMRVRYAPGEERDFGGVRVGQYHVLRVHAP